MNSCFAPLSGGRSLLVRMGMQSMHPGEGPYPVTAKLPSVAWGVQWLKGPTETSPEASVRC